jgi:hypothetical protein
MGSSEELPIEEMPQPLGIYAGEVRNRALEYWQAFQKLAADDGGDLKYVNYFLLAHSLELMLKAFLHSQGVSKRDAKAHDVRHEPVALLDRCIALGLPAIPGLSDLAVAFREMNSDHDFRYPSGCNLHLPGYRLCTDIFEHLVEATAVPVSGAATDAQLRFVEETRHLKGKARIRWSD